MNKKGGGLDLIFSSKYKAEALPHTQYDSFASALWRTQLGSTHCTILGAYHTPQGTHNGLTNNIFLDDITNLLTEVSSRFNNIILLDDLNIHKENQQDNDVILLTDKLEAFNFTQHIKSPMHNLGHTLDLIATEYNSRQQITSIPEIYV